MRLARGLICAFMAAAIGVSVAGCDSITDLLDVDFLNTKKKLPGERKPVFPEGVPGVAQGVPAEYQKGYDPQAAQAAPDPAAAAVQKVEPDKGAKPKTAAKPKPKPVTRQPPPAEQSQSQPQPQSQPQQQPTAAWPSAPSTTQFSR
jgi:hypothetical protein